MVSSSVSVGIQTLRPCHFESSEDKESNLEKLLGVATLPPSSCPLQNIGILLHKQATRAKHFDGECILHKEGKPWKGPRQDLKEWVLNSNGSFPYP